MSLSSPSVVVICSPYANRCTYSYELTRTGFVNSCHYSAVKGKGLLRGTHGSDRGRSFSMSEESNFREKLPHLSEVMPTFLRYAAAELQFAKESLVKYEDCLRQVRRIVGDKAMDAYDRGDIL